MRLLFQRGFFTRDDTIHSVSGSPEGEKSSHLREHLPRSRQPSLFNTPKHDMVLIYHH